MSDVVPLLQLISEVTTLRDDARAWRMEMLSRLNQVLPASASAAFILKNVSAAEPPVVMSLFDAGFKNGAQRQAFLQEFNTAPFRDPLSQKVFERAVPARPTTFSVMRSDLVEDQAWHNSPHVQQFRKPSGMDDCIISVHLGLERGSGMALMTFRNWGDNHRFTGRERSIVGSLHAGLSWLYRTEETNLRINRATPLSPRLKQTLEYLLAGDTERQVAMRLSLSVHTVHDYVKALYLHFGVSSRSELLNKWVQTGGQLPPPTHPQ